jgi:uncharacterized membrane protein
MRRHLSKAVLFGVAAAVCYSLQHPLSKPFLMAFNDDLTAAAAGVILSETVVFLLVAGKLVISADFRAGFKALFNDRRQWRQLAVLTVLSTFSTVFYVFVIREYNTVMVALILNIYPVYQLIVSSVVEKRPIDWSVMVVFTLISAGVMIPQFGLMGIPILETIKLFLYASIVPICYAISVSLQSKFFEGHSAATYIAASSAVDAPIAIAIAYLFITLNGSNLPRYSLSPQDTALFAVGAVFSGLIARWFFQKGRAYASTDEAYASFWMYFIPVFSGFFGLLLQNFGYKDMDVGFNVANIWGIFVLIIGGLALVFLERQRRQ